MNSFYFACLYACYFGFAGILCCECKGYKKTLDTSVISISLDNRVIDVAPLRSYIDHDEYLRDQGLNYDTSSFSSSFAIYENYMFCFFMVYSIVMFL
ncbi:hypothetical protein ERO13_D12G034400v2 [Gossypium hirsutum]|uniref:Uncharacterized protein n=3 Tax=Gossypium TaxID=3633 RepID=A0A5J5NU93_GOSBA|nr:hypothetical protein ES319_D12G036400v1 [Gossypium barbadense]KAG4114254.1 hypothetical protein ERO13_D12G034400v2 [Gossypium hirsutum]TYG39724.1 hypothetical protein ES288_D12G037800v1 [Gossypium darwinii]TYH37401.1 hypothetical protein ES332_D12G037600v1 [Gossypium tomentosum]